MPDIKIEILKNFDTDSLRKLITGYISNKKYSVKKIETNKLTIFSLELVNLKETYNKHEYTDDESIKRYKKILTHKTSFGAYDKDKLIGIAIGEIRSWNQSFWVHEFHILNDYRRKGIGTKLMNSVISKAKKEELRIIVCETQNFNVPAIEFYRKMGFEIDGIDLSYYCNNEKLNEEIAIFMKKKIKPQII